MSRIGRQVITVPDGVEVKVTGDTVVVKKGSESLSQQLDPRFIVKVDGNEVRVERPSDAKEDKAKHGLYRSLINNMVIGLNTGFQKTLQINGVGFRVQKSGKTLNFNLGYSHPVTVDEPEGITLDVPNQTTIVVKGADKQLVGETAAKIRALRIPDVYHGKGIKYDTEILRLREGKTGAK